MLEAGFRSLLGIGHTDGRRIAAKLGRAAKEVLAFNALNRRGLVVRRGEFHRRDAAQCDYIIAAGFFAHGNALGQSRVVAADDRFAALTQQILQAADMILVIGADSAVDKLYGEIGLQIIAVGLDLLALDVGEVIEDNADLGCFLFAAAATHTDAEPDHKRTQEEDTDCFLHLSFLLFMMLDFILAVPAHSCSGAASGTQ